MPRRIVEGSLSVCVVLLMFGTAAVAEDELFFDLSHAVAEVGDGAEAGVVEGGPFETTSECPNGNCPEQTIAEGGIFGWHAPAPHFELPSRSFSLFRSPVSYGWGYQERCCPIPWKPRGNGIPKRNSAYRMDFAPYVLEHDRSKHGPAFYKRYELYPCEECHHHAKHLRDYYGCPY